MDPITALLSVFAVMARCLFPKSSEHKGLTPNDTEFGGGALGMLLGLDEAIRVGPQDGTDILLRIRRDMALSLL